MGFGGCSVNQNNNSDTNIKLIEEQANKMNLGGPARGGLVDLSHWRIS